MDGTGRSVAERLGIDGADPALIARALVHRSWSTEHDGAPHNERLELLGDAVLDLVVTAELHELDPDASEGVLSRRRAQLVRESSLATVARSVELGADIRLGRGEAASGGAEKDSLLADTLEAIIGAVFLSGGYDAAAGLVGHLLGDAIRMIGTADPSDEADPGPVDPKTALQERAAALRLPVPQYRTVQEGPDHAPTFQAEVRIGDELLGSGSGGSKKAASQAAAEQALRHRTLG
jgi:ribonuclease III